MTTLFAFQVKAILKERGWTSVEVAARWKISVVWMSKILNDPTLRPAMYEDAVRGLPNRCEVTVIREKRHVRKSKKKEPFDMFPIGRIFEAENNQVFEEGTRVVVRSTESNGQLVFIQAMDGGETFSLSAAEMHVHFADTTLSESD